MRASRFILAWVCVVGAVSVFGASEGGDEDSDVVVLTTDNFNQNLGTGKWIVEFYSPRCGHCKRLAPEYEKAATSMKGTLNFGKVDSTAHPELRDKFDVKGYPTLLYFNDGPEGDHREFKGQRTSAGLIDFGKRVTGPAVHIVRNAEQYKRLISKDPVAIVLKLDGADKNHPVFKAYTQTATEMQDELIFALCDSEFTPEGWSAGASLAAVEKGESPKFFQGAIPSTAAEISEWVADNRFPLVSAIGPANFRTIVKSGRMLVMLVAQQSQRKAIESLKAIPRGDTGVSPAVLARYRFGWLDGVAWRDYVNQFFESGWSTSDLPRIVVLDQPNESFWFDPLVDELDEIDTFITDIANGRETKQRMGWWGKVDWAVSNPPVLAGIVGLLVLVVVALYFALKSPKETAPKAPKSEDSEDTAASDADGSPDDDGHLKAE